MSPLPIKKSLFLLFFNCFIFLLANSQSNSNNKAKKIDLRIDVSAALHLPVGSFASTHKLGFGIDVSPSYHTFGLLSKVKIAFTYNGGIAYYPGKKETVSGYPFDYPGYFFIHAFAGGLLIPSNKVDVSLTAGPALGIYDGNARFNLGSRLGMNYHLKKILVGPGIIIMKEKGTDPLWAAFAKATISL